MDNKKQEMVNWFSFSVLWDALKRSILSKLFGQYADPRLLYNASSKNTNSDSKKEDSPQDHNREIWFDFVADVGDGYSSTYTIAYLLGKEYLEINNERLPQGDFLIMGGDQVYPTPTRENYKLRTTSLYSDAYPDQGKKSRKPIYLLPGNHDWYDGLRLFTSLFCDLGKKNQFCDSNWELPQKQSYFFIKLPHNWRILGIDTQLECDIDKPQANYFLKQLEADDDSSFKKIIICTSDPSWLTANSDDRYKRGLEYITNNVIAESYQKYRICAVLAGDLHHYARYSLEPCETEFITAGGGGAFLHPTHSLDKKTFLKWQKKPTELHLKCTYPSQEESLKEAKQIWWKFLKNNWKFGIILSFIYTIVSLLLAATSIKPTSFCSLLQNPFTAIFLILFIFIFYKYDQSLENQKELGSFGIIHGASHFIALLCWMLFWPYLFSIKWMPWGYSTLLIMLLTFVSNTVTSAFIFGIYLWYCSFYLHRKDNDSFSSLRLDTYKNFLKIKITKTEMTIYPIGVSKPLHGSCWKKNEEKTGAKVMPDPEKIKNEEEIYHLIEKPIVISTQADDLQS